MLVIHTLCNPPQKAGHGYGRQMVEYAKRYAAEVGCTTIRIDTYVHNEPTKRLYLKNGFRIAGYGQILLQGLIRSANPAPQESKNTVSVKSSNLNGQ